MGVTCAFGTIYLYTSELYPTSLRTGGLGFSSTCGRVGAVLSPYVAMLSKVRHWLPLVVFGGAAILSGLLALLLPETLGRDLPETVQVRGAEEEDEIYPYGTRFSRFMKQMCTCF